MSKNKVTCRDFTKRDGWVFVTPASIPNEARIQQNAQDWVGVAKSIVNETPASPEPKPATPKDHNPRETLDTIARNIRQRQLKRTKAGIKKVKSWRGKPKPNLKALLADVDAKLGVRS